MKILVWQWGRRGAGPRVAAELATSLRGLPDTEAALSLSARAEILRGAEPPECWLRFDTYQGLPGLLRRAAQAPLLVRDLARRLRALGPDVAICAMPAALDAVMAAALRRAGIPFLVVVHDADPHPGDLVPFQAQLQRRVARRADGLVALSGHVADRLRAQGLARPGRLLRAPLPPLAFGPMPPPPGAHGGPARLLSFGRLLPYKGLDLLDGALRRLGPRPGLVLRVVGSGPDSPVLDALRARPGVSVENRWVPEDEVGALLAWADALVLSHREASQSGVAAAALAAGRRVVATRVGGLAEQLRGEGLALMCDPTEDSLAGAIERVLADPPELPPPPDPREEWRRAASDLRGQIAAMLAGRS